MITVNSDGQPVSQEFAEAVARPIVGYSIALLSGGSEVECDMRRMQLSLGSTGDAGASGNGIEVGGVFSAQAEIQLASLSTQLTGEELEVRIGVDAGGTVEYVTVATLTALGVRKSFGSTTVSAAGSITAKMGGQLGTEGWTTAGALAAAIGSASGVSVHIGPFATTEQRVYVERYATCRQALASLAAALGGFAAEQADGSVLVCPFSSTPSCSIGEDSMTAYPQLDEADYVLDGLTVAVPSDAGEGDGEGTGASDAFYTFGTGRYVMADAHATAETAAATWSNLQGYTYRPGTVVTAVLDPRITPFDVAAVEVEGVSANVPALGIQATFDGGYFGTISAPGMSRAAEEAAVEGPVTQAVDRAALAAGRASAAAASAMADATRAAGAVLEIAADVERVDAEAKEADAAIAADVERVESETGAALAQIRVSVESASDATARAESDAEAAKASAESALSSARSAAYGLADVERVVGTVGRIARSGRYVSQEGEAFDAAATYYARDASGDRIGPDGERYSLVEEPSEADVASYYRLEVDESIAQYVASHLWEDDFGLNLAVDGAGGYRLHEGTVDGTRPMGLYILDGSGGVVQALNAGGGQMGRSGESRMELDYHSFKLVDREDPPNVYAWFSDLRPEGGTIRMTETFSADDAIVSAGSDYGLGYEVVSEVYLARPGVLKTVDVEVNGEEPDDLTFHASEDFGTVSVILPFALEEGDEVVVRYQSTSPANKAYTLGVRDGGSTVGSASLAEGYETAASGIVSHAEGYKTRARGAYSHAEGRGAAASASAAHAEGWETEASGPNAHAEGAGTGASGRNSHAEGINTEASDNASHAEGAASWADGSASHAEGRRTTASGVASHAEGADARAGAFASHAQNLGTVAGSEGQTALGRYNVEDAAGEYAVIVGNGTSDSGRSNAAALTWEGVPHHRNPRGDWGSVFDLVYPVGSVYMSVNATSPAELFGGEWKRIQGRFLLGATEGATGAGASRDAGSTGGAASVKLTAAQSGVPAHSHGMNHKHKHAHTHGMNEHTHSTPDHVHNNYVKRGNFTAVSTGDTTVVVHSTQSSTLNSSMMKSSGSSTTGKASGSTAAASAAYTGNALTTGSSADAGDTSRASTDKNTAAAATEAHDNMPPFLAVYMWQRTA